MPPGGIVGADKYDYKYLCMPSMPWTKGGVPPPKFLSKDERLPLVVALSMGFQHALAMVAGIATSGGLLIAGDACFPWQRDSAMCEAREYMISAAWITSGILTIIQVFRAKVIGTPFYLGTGLISVMGTSFTFLPIAREMVVREIRDASAAGKCDGGDCRGFGKEGYGKFLGTCMVASLVEIAISLMPSKVRKMLFPPVVTGAAVMLIGVSLISSGIKYVGGGVFCGENDFSRSAAFGGPQYCNENGNVILPFGSAEYVGLAASVIAFSVFVQFAGSPFMKSTFIFWGLMFGCFVAGVSRYEAVEGDMTFDFSTSNGRVQANMVPAVPGRKYKYFNDYKIRNAPWFTFLWDTTFPLGFAKEYFLPIVIGFFVSTAETIGDVTNTCFYSRLPTEGADFESRVQGGLLADGVNSLLAALFTSPPNTTFSQNNGVRGRVDETSFRRARAIALVFEPRPRAHRAFSTGDPAHAVRVARRGLRLRVLADPLRRHRQDRRGVLVDPHLRRRRRRVAVLRHGLRLGHEHRDAPRDAPQQLHPHGRSSARHRRRHGAPALRGRRPRGVLRR